MKMESNKYKCGAKALAILGLVLGGERRLRSIHDKYLVLLPQQLQLPRQVVAEDFLRAIATAATKGNMSRLGRVF